ncbi:hypothetical protein EUX98_g3747 [Antrodiella citrinella]|uniref:Uncharacterized protein n=1 Tax=Antrodiella citrinella TaxID=2447956 RepID=A0A4V3XIT4_9APHY|nr:hypothetical protein EUX98_g3747 [Antrodiella citrinella]
MKGFKSSFSRTKSSSGISSGVPTPTSETPTSPSVEVYNGGDSPIVSEAPKEKEKKSLFAVKSKEKPPSPPDPERTKEYILAASERMDEIEKLLEQVRAKKSKMSHEIARKILSAVGSAMPVLEAVASLHPISSNVFMVFQGVFELQNMRQEHEETIVEVFYEATVTMWSLARLATLEIEEDFKHEFAKILSKIKDALEELTEYIGTYYEKNIAVRIATVHKATDTLNEFKTEFEKQRTELNLFINTHTAATLQRDLKPIGKGVNKLLTIAAESRSETLQKLSENARKAQEQMGDMNLNLTSMMNKLLASQLDTKESILKRLESGPHENIKVEEMKLVWKAAKHPYVDMAWRNTVKCRHFLDAVQDHFFKRFAERLKNTSEFHQDQWTLDILSKSIFYPGIGDAIDGDSSAFISVTELNDFLAKLPPTWSVAEWFTFWAVGWTQTNMTYREKIHETWQEITAKTSSLIAQSGPDHALSLFHSQMETFIKSAVGVPEEDVEEEFISLKTEAQLHRLNVKYKHLQEFTLDDRLNQKPMRDVDAVLWILGSTEARIELHLMPLVYVSLGQFLKKFDAISANDQDIVELVTQYDQSRRVMESMFARRLAELVQIWSQQKQHLPTQVAGFCGGIFKSYYETVFEKARREKRAKKIRDYDQADE